MYTPPDYGLGAGSLTAHARVLGFDTEGFRAPSRTVGKRDIWTRKMSRLVCSQFAGRGDVPGLLVELEDAGHALVARHPTLWSAVLDRRGSRDFLPWAFAPGNDHVVVAHNAAFDLTSVLHFLRNDVRFRGDVFEAVAAGRVLDTVIREKLIAIAGGWLDFDDVLQIKRGLFSLNTCVRRRFGVDLSESKHGEDAWRLRYHELDGVPLHKWPPAAVEYARSDAEWALLLAEVQAPVGAPQVTEHLDPVTTADGGVVNEVPQVQADLTLYLASAWSLPGDAATHGAWEEELLTTQAANRAKLQASGIYRPNGVKNTKIVQDLIATDFALRGLEPPRTDTGRVSTAADALKECTHPDLAALSGMGFVEKQISTYLEPARLAVDGVAPYSYDVLKGTGRVSSFDANITNPPREGQYREIHVARPGRVLCSTDYKAAELCALGQIHLWKQGSSALADALNAGIDPHCVMGAQLAGVPYETFMEWSVPTHPNFKRYKLYRQVAKIPNFGLPGGLGASTLITYARGMGVDLAKVAQDVDFDGTVEDFAWHLIRVWRETWPEAPAYMQGINSKLAHGPMTYKQFVSRRNRGRLEYCPACNTGFQGLVADGAKDACWRLSVLCYVEPERAVQILSKYSNRWSQAARAKLPEWARALYGCRLVIFVHDETIVEGPEETLHEWAEAQAAVMVEALQAVIPDVKIEAEPAAMRRWYKDAATVRDSAGRLVPWEPAR